jgi:hypothetical protein
MREGQKLTFGEKAVGLTDNPLGNQIVVELKKMFAEIIDVCALGRVDAKDSLEKQRLWSIAITEAQTAQMFAVKAATWED